MCKSMSLSIKLAKFLTVVLSSVLAILTSLPLFSFLSKNNGRDFITLSSVFTSWQFLCMNSANSSFDNMLLKWWFLKCTHWDKMHFHVSASSLQQNSWLDLTCCCSIVVLNSIVACEKSNDIWLNPVFFKYTRAIVAFCCWSLLNVHYDMSTTAPLFATSSIMLKSYGMCVCIMTKIFYRLERELLWQLEWQLEWHE